jgi:hypothetical protein
MEQEPPTILAFVTSTLVMQPANMNNLEPITDVVLTVLVLLPTLLALHSTETQQQVVLEVVCDVHRMEAVPRQVEHAHAQVARLVALHLEVIVLLHAQQLQLCARLHSLTCARLDIAERLPLIVLLLMFVLLDS